MKQLLDFIVIGAQKAGTTSLFEYMRPHPELWLPLAKEMPYFSHDQNYERDWRSYLNRAFAFADPCRKWGTATPTYMVGGTYEPFRSESTRRPSNPRTVPTRIHDQLPQVRLIAILRDPVDRAMSHHTMAAMNGWDNRPFAQAIDELLQPAAIESARQFPEEANGYITWGEYGRILSGYLDVFDRSQLLVLYTSDLQSDPKSVMRKVFSFLDVEPDFVPENLGTVFRPAATSRRLHWLRPRAAQAAIAENPVARRVWRSLPVSTRRKVDNVVDRVSYRTDLWNRRDSSDERTMDAGVARALREHYAADSARLAELLGSTPPWAAEMLVSPSPIGRS
jgi:Sulfotransferase domain